MLAPRPWGKLGSAVRGDVLSVFCAGDVVCVDVDCLVVLVRLTAVWRADVWCGGEGEEKWTGSPAERGSQVTPGAGRPSGPRRRDGRGW